jgi:hypothetical protein
MTNNDVTREIELIFENLSNGENRIIPSFRLED